MKKIINFMLVCTMFLAVSCSPKNLETKDETSSVVSQENIKESDQKSKNTKSFVMGAESINSTLDPAIEWNGWHTIRYGVGETLFKFDENLQVVPWLAEGYENIDENTWKITLRNNIKFSNGESLTPEMVVKNLKRVAENNERAEFLKDAEYTIKENDIEIKTKQARATFINDISDPYAAIIDLDNTKDLNKAPIGTGAYMVDSIVDDSEVVLLPNKNYWNGSPKLDKVTVKAIADKQTGALALKNGEIDAFIEVNPQSYKEFEADDNFKVQSIPTARVYTAYYNLETISDKSLRQAIHLALDKEAIGKFLLNGSMTPSEGPFPESTAYGSNKLEIESFDLEKAKSILESSGYTDSDGNGFIEKDGQEINLRILYFPRLSSEQVATEVQASLKRLGINSSVSQKDNSEYLSTGDYDIGLYTIVTLATGDPESYIESRISKDGITNFNKFSNEEANSLLENLEHEYDTNKRAEITNKIQQLLLDDYVSEYFGHNNLNIVSKSNVEGLVAHPTDYYQITVDLDVK